MKDLDKYKMYGSIYNLEFLTENLDRTIVYSEFLAENLDRTIEYSYKTNINDIKKDIDDESEEFDRFEKWEDD